MTISLEDEGMVFRLIKTSTANGFAARIGRLALPQRKPIDTPNYIAISSRGAIPHLTPDVVTRHTQISGSYMALEDFIEQSMKRQTPALYAFPQSDGVRSLHAYTATPPNITTILAARRHPAVVCPSGNRQDFVSIFTSTGFKPLKQDAYSEAVVTIKPDVVIPLADLTYGASVPGAKRQRRMVERSGNWINEFFKSVDVDETLKKSGIHVFAPLLPVSNSLQWEYLKRLSTEHASRLAGLAVYDTNVLADMVDLPSLASLPRLSIETPPSPHHVLRQVRSGIDVFAIPFVNAASDAGIALTFSFPPPAKSNESVRALGVDVWSREHRVALQPLLDWCDCYTCKKHHRAYLQHLMNAREMLGWTLLQIHNHHLMDKFFEGVRDAIADETFEDHINAFTEYYEAELPQGTGERPRARGYHFKPEAGQPKINSPTWEKYEGDGVVEKAVAAEAAGLAVTGTADEGGAEISLAAEADADTQEDVFRGNR